MEIPNMRALLLSEKGKPLSFLKDVSSPKATDNQVVVELKAAALNHRDLWILKGKYPGIKYPVIPGSDGAGMLGGREIIINPASNWGSKVSVQSENFHILGLPENGTFAERVLVAKSKIVAKPDHLTWEQAAALPLGGLTAYRALFTKCQSKRDEKVLISGVGGGVALFACQFAVAAGMKVYVTSGSDEKIEKAIKLGATGGANYRSENWAKNLASQADGFDVVIDSAGGEGFANLVKLCHPAARICMYGGTKGLLNEVSPQLIFWKQLSIFGSTMGTNEEFSQMVNFVGKHKIVPIVDSVFELKDGNKALEKMEKGLQFGKIVLKIS